MNEPIGADARDLLATWRQQGADSIDPVRFHFLEALARRAAMQTGRARQVLEARMSDLLQAYGKRLDTAVETADAVPAGRHPGAAACGPLAELVDYATRDADAGLSMPGRAAYPELALLDYFRATWSRVSTDRQLRQSEDRVPENAGPINSSHLVHRSLSLMRSVAPGYLQHFLAYVDALSWMEQLNETQTPGGKDAARATAAKKSGRAKPR